MAPPSPYVSRGGIKLEAALRAFELDVTGFVCADLGCNVGGFTHCLLEHGAARVYAVDTGYGALAWKLRQDPRVVVLERTNALHFDPATLAEFSGCDLVTVDLAWTRQSRAVVAAKQWLKRISDFGFGISDLEESGNRTPAETLATGNAGCVASSSAEGKSQIRNPKSEIPLILSLIKPHYEAERALLHRGVLDPADAEIVAAQVLQEMPALGVRVLKQIHSPILGGAGKGKAGNVEYLALLEVVAIPPARMDIQSQV